MIKVTKQQRANLLEALHVMWPSVPERNVAPRLSDWTVGENNRTNCSTIACFGGWCARWPGFRSQGVRLSHDGVALWRSGGYGHKVASRLFGDAALFDPRDTYVSDCADISDHEIVTRRLEWLLANSEVKQ